MDLFRVKLNLSKMTISKKETIEQIKNIISSERLSVLATDDNGIPHTSLIGFLLDDDLKNLYFFTSSNTKKYKNIENNPKVSLLIDNRDIFLDKTYLITSVTVLGHATIIKKPIIEVVENFLKIHREFKDFIKSDFTVLVKIVISRYIVVNRLKEVIEIKI
jgi:nitroimidazol reductase NimA-like FMN-containing flavoprotein (pyridoxamine 5'-phosphate oxidase superfamily)